MKNTLLVLLSATFLLTGCGNSGGNVEANNEVMSADFNSLDTCLNRLKGELGALTIITDSKDNVSGIQPNGVHWGCTKEESGTKGIYWNGFYDVK